MELEVVHSKSGKTLATLTDVTSTSTIEEVKWAFMFKFPKFYTDRQAYKVDPKGKSLKDTEILKDLGITGPKAKIYFKDLGPQIGWGTVFIAEYAGPLFLYLVFYPRPWFIYGPEAIHEPRSHVVQLAAACWSFHYGKRLFETMFVHRFSNSTMPITNIFKNCGYYWGFTAFIAYFINHPLYTPPMFGDAQVYGGLAAFCLCELGNLSIHLALRWLRPAGSKERKIPYPTGNPFTYLFNLVSCPNYTYEVGAWISFTIMTQSLPAALFTLAGMYQMSMWAIGKHKNYKKEFKAYPRRRCIIPFLL